MVDRLYRFDNQRNEWGDKIPRLGIQAPDPLWETRYIPAAYTLHNVTGFNDFTSSIYTLVFTQFFARDGTKPL